MAGKAHPREHGTMKGWKQHEYRKEQPCRECLDFRAGFMREVRGADRDKYRQYAKEYRSKNVDRVRDNARKRYARNANKERARARKRLAEKNEHINALRRKRYEENAEFRERTLSANRQRRAIRKGVDYAPYSVDDVLELYGVLCHLCSGEIDLSAPRKTGAKGFELGLHIDHVIPISLGGPDTLDNLRPAHAVCNLSKGAKIGGIGDITPQTH
jgi:5-methylcytosine-specific restriction endonuclease McrA